MINIHRHFLTCRECHFTVVNTDLAAHAYTGHCPVCGEANMDYSTADEREAYMKEVEELIRTIRIDQRYEKALAQAKVEMRARVQLEYDLAKAGLIIGKNYRGVDMRTLPVGTEFHVLNGCWDGQIIEEDGVKKMWIENDRKVPLTSIDDDYTLDIRIEGDDEQMGW